MQAPYQRACSLQIILFEKRLSGLNIEAVRFRNVDCIAGPLRKQLVVGNCRTYALAAHARSGHSRRSLCHQ